MDENDQINKSFQLVYDQLYNILTASPGKKAGDQSPAYYQPVIQLGVNTVINPVDYKNAASPGNPHGNFQSAYNFSALVNNVPVPGKTATDTGKKLDETFYAIVKGANACYITEDSERIPVEEEMAKLYNEDQVDTPMYAKYKELQGEYNDALVAWLTALGDPTNDTSKPSWQAVAAQLRNDTTKAWNNWKASGKKTIEDALATISSHANNAVELLISRTQDTLEQTAQEPVGGASGKWHLSYALPSGWCDDQNELLQAKLSELDDAEIEIEGRIDKIEGQIDDEESADTPDKKKLKKLNDQLKPLKTQQKTLLSANEKKRKALNDQFEKTGTVGGGISLSQFVINSKNSRLHQHDQKDGFDASMKASYGLFKASAQASGSKETHDLSGTNSEISISGEIGIVRVIRPWFDPTILSAEGWANNMYKKGPDISDGWGGGFLPMYTTSLVVCNNLTLAGKFSSNEDHSVANTLSAGGSVGYGPFSFGGSYNHSDYTRDVKKKDDTTSIRNPGVSIIGFINQTIPWSPRTSWDEYEKAVEEYRKNHPDRWALLQERLKKREEKAK